MSEQISFDNVTIPRAQMRDGAADPTESNTYETELVRRNHEIERLTKELEQAERECERLRTLVPTTAQSIVYQGLLMKYEKAQKACAEMREALEAIADDQFCGANHETLAKAALAHAKSLGL